MRALYNLMVEMIISHVKNDKASLKTLKYFHEFKEWIHPLDCDSLMVEMIISQVKNDKASLKRDYFLNKCIYYYHLL